MFINIRHNDCRNSDAMPKDLRNVKEMFLNKNEFIPFFPWFSLFNLFLCSSCELRIAVVK